VAHSEPRFEQNEQVQEVTVRGASLTSNIVALQWQLPVIAMSPPSDQLAKPVQPTIIGPS
jgi:hypothetical protein